MNDEEKLDELKIFVHNVVWLRKHSGFSKRVMADIIGVSIKTLNKIENGEVPPNLNVRILFNIQEFFDISPQDQLQRYLGD